MGVERYLLIAAGAGMLVMAWLVWTGRWKGPGHDLMTPNWAFSVLPAVGLMFVLFGLEPVVGTVLYVPLLFVLVAAWILALWQPEWFGPRWWRERDTTDLALDHGPNAMLAYFMKPGLGDQGSLPTVERMMAPRRPLARLHAALVDERFGRPSAAQRAGMVDGRLLVYDEVLVFAASATEDKFRDKPTIERVLARDVRGVRRLSRDEAAGSRLAGRVRIDTDRGPWVVETRRPGRLVAELEKRYGRSTGPMAVRAT